MNKTDLVSAVAEKSDLTKANAGRAVDAVLDAITEGLKSGNTITLLGFGTFSVKERAARTGRNPQTGATIEIKASSVPTFKAGKGLKDALA